MAKMGKAIIEKLKTANSAPNNKMIRIGMSENDEQLASQALSPPKIKF